MHLTNNVPGWERVARVAVGLGAAVGGVFWATAAGWWGWAVAVSGLVLAVTGVVGWCPLCAMVGRTLPMVERTVSIERL
jgi:hypothetical protein